MSSSNKPKSDKIEVIHVLPKLCRSIINLFPKKGNQIPNNEDLDDMTTNIINQVSNVVDLSVTGLKTADLTSFWDTLEKFKNLTSFEVAMAPQSSITLQDCGRELKKKLKRLRMEAHQFSIGSTSNQPPSGLGNLGVFESLTDLSLTSNTTIKDIKNIPGLPNVLCLRLYGVCREKNCQIAIRGFPKLMKLVIGDMEKVTTLEIGCDVIGEIATLKLYKLPRLRIVVFSKNPLLTWNSSGKVDKTSKISETIFLRKFGHFPADIKPGLMIYHSSIDKQWTKYIMCE